MEEGNNMEGGKKLKGGNNATNNTARNDIKMVMPFLVEELLSTLKDVKVNKESPPKTQTKKMVRPESSSSQELEDDSKSKNGNESKNDEETKSD